ncbi:MMPL family transporter, partial [Myxococcota bacterium]|nr:MMPL family transporter [Myxococcota bacterium]
VHAANDLVNEEFGGSTGLSLVATGDIKSPEVLAQIEALQTKLDGMPSIGQTTSVVDVVKKMNRVMHDDRLEQEVIPQSRDAVAQYFLMYSLSGDPEDLDQLVDFPFENAQIMARISSTSTSEIAKVVEEVESIIKEDANSPFTLVGGFGAILSEVVDAVITGQIWSLIFSFTVVVLMVGAIFLSPVAGLLAGLPLGLAIILLFGLMGLFKIELNATTAMLSSIMIGVGIDYTIHFLWRYKKEVHAGRDALEAVRSTMKTTGRGIVFNALSVIVGFTVLMFSAFLPVKYFGFLIVVSIGVCLVGALVLLPAILILTKPSFIFAHPKTK